MKPKATRWRLLFWLHLYTCAWCCTGLLEGSMASALHSSLLLLCCNHIQSYCQRYSKSSWPEPTDHEGCLILPCQYWDDLRQTVSRKIISRCKVGATDCTLWELLEVLHFMQYTHAFEFWQSFFSPCFPCTYQLWLGCRQGQAEEQCFQRSLVPLHSGFPAVPLHRCGCVAAHCWCWGHLASADFSLVGSPRSHSPYSSIILCHYWPRLFLPGVMQVSHSSYFSRSRSPQSLPRLNSIYHKIVSGCLHSTLDSLSPCFKAHHHYALWSLVFASAKTDCSHAPLLWHDD